MANYSTNLKTWGSTGSIYPDGYSYIVGEQPVDEWDNFVTYNAIEDIKHLIELTNTRLESSVGAADPVTPETGELIFRTDLNKLRQYDGSSWHTVLFADNAQLEGNFDVANYQLQNVGTLRFPEDGGARTLADMAITSGEVAGTEESFSLKIDGTTFVKAYAEADGAGGLQNTYVDVPVGSLRVSGTEVSVEGHHHDDRYVDQSGDTMSGNLVIDGEYLRVPVYTTAGDLPGGAPEGAIVYVQDEGTIYVEDGA